MSFETALLVTGGFLAIVTGTFVILFVPGRLASTLVGLALALLGLEQLAWARAIHAAAWGGVNLWTCLSLAFALPVSLTWVLASITLARGNRALWSRGWRVFLLTQALFALAAVVLVHRFAPVGAEAHLPGGDVTAPLQPLGRVILADLLLNVLIMTASFESTYLRLPLQARRSFRPGLLGILLLAGHQGYWIITGLHAGRVSMSELALGGLPTAAAAVLLPFSLLRSPIAEIAVRAPHRPVHQTATLLLGAGILMVVPLMLLMSRATGLSLARSALVLSIAGLGLAIAALAISNRLQRALRFAFDPYLHRGKIDERGLWTRLSTELEPARTLDELYRLIPRSASTVAGIGPVTLYVFDRPRSVYVPMASTLEPMPDAIVGMDDPLPATLRRVWRPIHLRGRTDDLEFIPIYVENAGQIAACEAMCAVPLAGGGELFGFLLCGRAAPGDEGPYPLLSLLEVVARQCADRLEFLRAASDIRTPSP